MYTARSTDLGKKRLSGDDFLARGAQGVPLRCNLLLWRSQTAAAFSEKWFVTYENLSAEKRSPRESNKALLETLL